MSQFLELPDPIYRALDDVARANGMTPDAWIAAHLPVKIDQYTDQQRKTLADLMQGHIGRIASGNHGSWTQESKGNFTDYLVQKKREGHL